VKAADNNSLSLRPEALELFRSIVTQHGFDASLLRKASEENPEHAQELELLATSWRSVELVFASWNPDPSVLLSAAKDLAERSLTARVELEQLLAELRAPRRTADQLGERQVLASGGMALVYRVRDRMLQRELAMKVLRSEPSSGASPAPGSARDSHRVRRFLTEARLTARLDHPGIVPVHELGVDEHGTPFFTMRLVRGSSLADVLRAARAGDRQWTLSRILEVILNVCDAVAYAHSQGVVHRDLKPTNIMVGAFGETYVMDWGLARGGELEEPQGGLSALGGGDDEDPITGDGDVIGTPNYMPPEQASGAQEQVGPRSDVYALGAVLYQLLTGRPPYADLIERREAPTVLAALLRREPTPIRVLAPEAPEELVAVAQKAMSRDVGERYADMSAVAEDLRAYIGGRVVLAHEQGVGAELRKWLKRNRVLAYTAVFALLSLASWVSTYFTTSHRYKERERFKQDLHLAATLASRAEQLWPAVPEQLPALRAWLTDAEHLQANAAPYMARLHALERRALPAGADDSQEKIGRRRREQEKERLDAELRARRIEQLSAGNRGPSNPLFAQALKREIRMLEARLERARIKPGERFHYDFADPSDETEYMALLEFHANLRELNLEDPWRGAICSVRARIALAERLCARSIEDVDDLWLHACDSIQRLDVYHGLKLAPQLGLVPLRINEVGYWEFTHILSGEAVRLDERGKCLITPDSGIVLVLIPGGEANIGSAPLDLALREAEDVLAQPDECPQTRVALDPYFLAKHEITVAQWYRARGEIPNRSLSGRSWDSDLDPVEGVSWTDARRALNQWGLALPTEAQWEHAARGSTRTPWWTGTEPISLAWRVNGRVAGISSSDFPSTIAVHTMQDGPFGIHHMLGNVSEWVADHYWPSYLSRFRQGDGLQDSGASGARVLRGGGAIHEPQDLRTARRFSAAPDNRQPFVGVRAARALDSD
jgi:formylglycine-generating enzyme required for sulfatase activity